MRRWPRAGWKYPVLPFNPQAIGKPALIIDALFRRGLNRPVKGDPLEMIEASTPTARRCSRSTCRAHQRHVGRGDGRCDRCRRDRDLPSAASRRIC